LGFRKAPLYGPSHRGGDPEVRRGGVRGLHARGTLPLPFRLAAGARPRVLAPRPAPPSPPGSCSQLRSAPRPLWRSLPWRVRVLAFRGIPFQAGPKRVGGVRLPLPPGRSGLSVSGGSGRPGGRSVRRRGKPRPLQASPESRGLSRRGRPRPRAWRRSSPHRPPRMSYPRGCGSWSRTPGPRQIPLAAARRAPRPPVGSRRPRRGPAPSRPGDRNGIN
jgi:hypothetical protein